MITCWVLISILLCVGYVCLQIFYVYNWRKIATPQANSIEPKSLSVAVVIPARNEATNIEHLLLSICQQTYSSSLIEIIIVDDFSEDNTASIAENILQQQNFSFKILQLKNYPQQHLAHKKSAIEYAISQTTQEIIITTDADCVVKPTWIEEIVQRFATTNANLIASPVLLIDNKKMTFWKRFECLDFCGMQLITGASIEAKIFNMANGANLAYKRAAFVACGGYDGINTKASGDDMLLIYKIAQLDKNKIEYLKKYNAIVQTPPTQNSKDFLHQRFRWAGKASDYQDWRISLMLLLVLLFCITIVVNFSIAIAYLIYYRIFPNYSIDGLINFLHILVFGILFVFQITLKTIIDYFLLNTATQFFRTPHLKKYFLISEYLHILYIVVVGILGNFVKPRWKGRMLR